MDKSFVAKAIPSSMSCRNDSSLATPYQAASTCPPAPRMRFLSVGFSGLWSSDRAMACSLQRKILWTLHHAFWFPTHVFGFISGQKHDTFNSIRQWLVQFEVFSTGSICLKCLNYFRLFFSCLLLGYPLENLLECYLVLFLHAEAVFLFCLFTFKIQDCPISIFSNKKLASPQNNATSTTPSKQKKICMNHSWIGNVANCKKTSGENHNPNKTNMLSDSVYLYILSIF